MDGNKSLEVSGCKTAFRLKGAWLLPLVVLSLAALSACVTKTVAPNDNLVVSFTEFPPQTVQAGSQTSLAATVANDAQDQGVDWNVSCSVTSCGSFNPTHTSDGESTTYTAPNTAPIGGVNLTARATAFPSESATQTVTISSEVSITITGTPASPLGSGTTTQVVAKVTGDPNNQGVNWMLSCGASTNCGSITASTASGVAATYTAPSGVTSSITVTITAIAVADTTQTATTSVVVNPSAAVSIAFATGTGAPPSSMLAGAAQNIIAIVSGDSLNLGVDWSVSCTGNGGNCGTLNSGNAGSPLHTNNGAPITYAAPTPVPAGGLNVAITASATASPLTAFIQATIAISNPVISISTISGAPTSLTVGGKATLSATVANDPLPPAPDGVDWTVSCTPDPSSNCGGFNLSPAHTTTTPPQSIIYTAPTIIPLSGSVTITATSTANPSSFSTATMSITASTAISISFATGANAPPSQLTASSNANIAAIVTNDSLPPLPNGVDWSVTCGSTGAGACGTFSGQSTAHTGSGVPVSYTAPPTAPTGSTVTITATSTASDQPGLGPVQSVPATITINNAVTTITFTQAVSPMAAGTSETIAATVQNDSSNAGVSWSVACTNPTTNASGCGSFNPTSSPGTSSPSTSFTAPPAVPAGGLTVTITAASLAPGAATGTAVIDITPNPNLSLLQGQYAFSVTGVDNAGPFYAVAGSIVADGNGNITGGEEDINTFQFECLTNAGLTGNYTVGPDGRGTINLQLPANFCSGAAQTLSFTVINGAGAATPSAVITEFDTFATLSGTMNLQDTTDIGAGNQNAISGSYAFLFSGLDLNGPSVVNNLSNVDFGGTFTVSTGGALTPIKLDQNDQVTAAVTKNSSTSGTYTILDSFGRGTATIGTGSGEKLYIFYVVDATHIKFISDGNQDFNFATSGEAFSQGGSFSGPFVFSLGGVDGSVTQSNPLVAGGVFSAAGTAGELDVDDNGQVTASGGNTFTGVVTGPTAGRGTMTLTVQGVTTVPVPSQFAFYPTASHGVLLMDLDLTPVQFTTIGTAQAQDAIPPTSLNGNFAMDLTGIIDGVGEEDANGQIIEDQTSAFTGTSNVNQLGVVSPGAMVTGTTGSSPTAGRLTGSLTFVLASPEQPQTLKELFYIANANNILFIEMDNLGETGGFWQMQTLTPAQ